MKGRKRRKEKVIRKISKDESLEDVMEEVKRLNDKGEYKGKEGEYTLDNGDSIVFRYDEGKNNVKGQDRARGNYQMA